MTVSELRSSIENNIKVSTEDTLNLLEFLEDDVEIPENVEKAYDELFHKDKFFGYLFNHFFHEARIEEFRPC